MKRAVAIPDGELDQAEQMHRLGHTWRQISSLLRIPGGVLRKEITRRRRKAGGVV